MCVVVKYSRYWTPPSGLDSLAIVLAPPKWMSILRSLMVVSSRNRWTARGTYCPEDDPHRTSGKERGTCMGQFVLVIIALAVILVFLIFSGLRVVQQYERGVLFLLGRLSGAKGPGLCWIPPFISRMIKVDLRL